jgi:hypothetical protein
MKREGFQQFFFYLPVAKTYSLLDLECIEVTPASWMRLREIGSSPTLLSNFKKQQSSPPVKNN